MAMDTGDAQGLFNVGRDFGDLLLKNGQRNEARKVLEAAAHVGHQSGLPDTDRVEALLEEAKKDG